AEQAEAVLEQVYSEARQQVPASNEFRNNLQHMEQRYTMESERLIHEMLAARHGVQLSLKRDDASTGNASEYGDNVDLF
ncbi:MAG: methyl-accepting chemotaxis protein, partial [Geobacter sp.]